MRIPLKTVFVSVFLVIFFACNSDDDFSFQSKYTAEDIDKMSGDNSKKWSIQAYYDHYNQKVLNAKSGCHTDDIFVFQKGSTEIQVTRGEVSCYEGSAEDEITTASYDFYEENGQIFISIGKAVSLNGVTKNTFFSLQLVELSNDHMIFASGEKGNYQVALVFVAI
jgi:hypothetical protein